MAVADSGVVSQYAGTIFQPSYSGTASAIGTVTPMENGAAVAMNGNAQGEAVGSATPIVLECGCRCLRQSSGVQRRRPRMVTCYGGGSGLYVWTHQRG
jgi:hypothetical protein